MPSTVERSHKSLTRGGLFASRKRVEQLAKAKRTVDDPEWQWIWTLDLSGEDFTPPVETRQKCTMVWYCEDTKKMKLLILTFLLGGRNGGRQTEKKESI